MKTLINLNFGNTILNDKEKQKDRFKLDALMAYNASLFIH